MGGAVAIRTDFSAGELRGLARPAEDADQARRLLSSAAVFDGMSRKAAAEIGAMGRQTLRRYRARVRSGTDTRTGSALPTLASAALAAFKTAVNTWLPKMDEVTRQEALAFANAWRPTPAPEPGQSPYGLLKLQRPSEMPIESINRQSEWYCRLFPTRLSKITNDELVTTSGGFRDFGIDELLQSRK
jgi:hypothetical protein